MNKIRPVSATIAGAMVAATAICTAAFAQSAGPSPVAAPSDSKNDENLQEITVTGSRIKGAAPVGSAVLDISREDIVTSGTTSTSDLMQTIPQVLNFGISEDSRSTPGGAGNINYSSGIDIHGLGPNATLTLLNGKRFVQSGSSGGLPDPNDIPTIMLERIDIVADGASAIYGSDAVAGVANLITRREFDGVEVRVQDGWAPQYATNNYGIIAGHSWETGNATASFEQSYHSDLNGNARGFFGGNLTSQGGGNYLSNNCNPGNILIGGVSYALPAMAAGTTNTCDNLKSQDLIPWQKRDGGTLSLTQTATNWVTFYFDGFMSRRDFNYIPGVQNGTITVPNSNPFYVSPPSLPAQPSETLGYAFTDAPVNNSFGYSKVYELTPAIKVDLTHNFEFDTSYSYGHDESLSNSIYGLNNGALGGALASGNPATAYNPFGGTTNPAVISSVFNSGFYAPGVNVEKDYLASVTGPVYKLPGGEIRIAVGYEWIYDSIHTGAGIGPPGEEFVTSTYASRTINAKFGEILIPVFGADNSLPGLHSLEFSLAKRKENYSDVGSTSNPKYGFNWSPIDNVSFHGAYGTSFRAPTLTEVHGALSALFVQTYATPTGPIQGLTLSGYNTGNPLSPETAITRSLGVDLKIPALPGFKFSTTFFDVDYTGQISSILSNLGVLQSPTIEAEYGPLIVRNPPPSLITSFTSAGYPVLGPLPNPVPVFVYGQPVNLGSTNTKGFDFQLSQLLGEFAFGVNGTYFLQFKTQLTPESPVIESLNTIYNPPRFRARFSAQWQHNPWQANAFVNYTNSYSNNQAEPTQVVSSYVTVDTRLAYDLGFDSNSSILKNFVVALSVQNLLNTNPPFVNIPESPNGGGGFDPTLANPIGRLVTISASKKW